MPSEWVQKGVDAIRGDDAFMYKQVAEEVGKKHVTELLGQHPFHPFDPTIRDPSHPCFEQNRTFYQCMSTREEDMPLHMKHVNCYHPFKVDLMKCLVAFRKTEREKREKALAEAAKGGAPAQQK